LSLSKSAYINYEPANVKHFFSFGSSSLMPITHIRSNSISFVLPFPQIPALYPQNDMVHIHHTQTGG